MNWELLLAGPARKALKRLPGQSPEVLKSYELRRLIILLGLNQGGQMPELAHDVQQFWILSLPSGSNIL